MLNLLHRLKEDFKAWCRDERRVAPGMRGRIYERKHAPASTSDVNHSSHQAKLSVRATVTRADGTVERYDLTNGKQTRI